MTMNKALRSVLSIAVLAAAFFAVTPQAAHATTSVSGKLVTPDTATGVSSAWLSLHDTGWTIYQSAYTSSDGSFSFNDVPTCTCILQVYANNTTYADPDDRTLNIVTGETTDLGNVPLASHNVIGTLTLPDGTTPATGVGVSLQKNDYTVYRWYTSNSTTGQVRFRVPSTGTYILRVYNDFPSTNPTHYAPADVTVTVTDTSTVLDVGAVKMKTANVTGVVKESNDMTVVSGAWLYAHNSSWTISKGTSSASDGKFGFYLPAGTYTLETYLPWTYGYGNNPDPQLFTVTDVDSVKDLGTVKQATANVFFKVTTSNATGNTPVGGASISVHNANWTVSKSATTSSTEDSTKGTASVAITTAGTYTVEVWANNATESNPDTFTFTHAAGDTHYYDGTNSSSVLKLQAPALRGTVQKTGGTAVQNANISLYGANYTNSRWTSTDSSGNFTVSTVPTGTYTLEVTPPWDATDLVAPDKITIALTKGTMDTTYQAAPIVLATAVKTITVTVVREDGTTPVTDASVNAWCMNGSGYRWGEVNSSGQFAMTVGKCKWQISTWPKWQNGVSPDWTYNGQPVNVEFTQANTVAESATVTLTVKSYTATIKGTVQNPDGTIPSGSSSVSIWCQDGLGNWAQLDANGAFSVKVAACTYSVNIYTPSTVYSSPEIAPVTIKANETKDLGIIKLVTKSSVIKGSVLDGNNKGLGGQNVYCYGKTTWDWASTTTSSEQNALGQYTVNVAPGTKMCYAYPSWCGYGDCANTTQYTTSYDPTEVIVNQNETKENVNFVFQAKDSTINGVIQDESGNLLDTQYGWVEARLTDSTQSWSNYGSNAEAGKFSIKVVGGPTGSPKQYNLGMWTSWGADYSMKSAEPVSVTSGETINNAVIKMVKKNAKVTGALKNESGETITDIYGSVFANCGPASYEWSSITNGTYSLNLTPGDCKIDYWVDYRLKDYYKTPLANDGKVTVAAEQTLTMDITLKKLDSIISGKVYAPDGGVQPNAHVSADTVCGGEKKKSSIYDMYGSSFNLEAVSDSDGNFTLKAPAGSFCMSATISTGLGYINPASQDVTVTADSPASLEFRFLKPDATVSGTVTIETTSASVKSLSQFRMMSGQASPAHVSAWADGGGIASVYTNDGSFTLNITSGTTWHVTASYTDTANNKIYKSKEYQVTAQKDSAVAQDIAMTLLNTVLPDAASVTASTDVTTVLRLDDGSTATIPTGAVADDNGTAVQYTVTATPSADVNETSDVNLAEPYAVDLNATYTTGSKAGQKVDEFQKDVVVTLAYDETQLTADGINEGTLSTEFWSDSSGSWKKGNSTTVDTTNNTVTTTASHFSKYGIVTKASSAMAPSITLAWPTDSGIVTSKKLVVYGSITDPAAALTMSVNSGTAKTLTVASDGTFTTTITNIKRGSNTIALNASNNAGSALPVTHTFTYNRAHKGTESKYVVVSPQSGSSQIVLYKSTGKVAKKFYAFARDLRANIGALLSDLNNNGSEQIVAYVASGSAARVGIYSTSGKLAKSFYPYGTGFAGGITVVASDVNNDGKKELVVAPKSGLPVVKVYSSKGKFMKSFYGSAKSFRGGLSIAAGDVNGDGSAEILTASAVKGSSLVRIYSDKGKFLKKFYMFSSKGTGAYNVAAADTNADGKDEIIGWYGIAKPEVRVYTNLGVQLASFKPSSATYGKGIVLTTGDLTRDGASEIIIGPRGKARPLITVYNGLGTITDNFDAYGIKSRGGVTLAASDLSGDGLAEVTVAPVLGYQKPFRIINRVTGTTSYTLYPYGKSFKGGMGTAFSD